MTAANDDELRALRRRAYARDSDIHLDPASLSRLRELEGARAEPEPKPEADLPEETQDAGEPVEQEPPADDVTPRPTPRALLWLMGLRRSTILIAIGGALVLASLATVLTLVQRVQTDPLQVGASQIARLSVDSGYEIPGFFDTAGGGLEDASPSEAYQAFHGLRVVTSSASFVAPTTPDTTCMSIFPEGNVTVTDDSFEGPIFGGCGAGEFPAIVQFTLDVEGLPEDLRSAFPDSTGLQFVYDSEHDEVVIFSDR